jgi:hypothetical protein
MQAIASRSWRRVKYMHNSCYYLACQGGHYYVTILRFCNWPFVLHRDRLLFARRTTLPQRQCRIELTPVSLSALVSNVDMKQMEQSLGSPPIHGS